MGVNVELGEQQHEIGKCKYDGEWDAERLIEGLKLCSAQKSEVKKEFGETEGNCDKKCNNLL